MQILVPGNRGADEVVREQNGAGVAAVLHARHRILFVGLKERAERFHAGGGLQNVQSEGPEELVIMQNKGNRHILLGDLFVRHEGAEHHHNTDQGRQQKDSQKVLRQNP